MPGILTCVGVGPGDPELVTLRGARALRGARIVFAPKAPGGGESLALSIARPHIGRDAEIVVLEYTMTADRDARDAYWREAAALVAGPLSRGLDAAYVTIGDPLLYSTWICLSREVAARLPDARILVIPGIDSVSVAASASGIPLGEAERPFTVLPGCRDLDLLERALDMGGTVAVMKLGRRLPAVAAILGGRGLLGRAVLATRIGLGGERVARDLTALDLGDPALGAMSVLLIDAG